MNHTDVHINKWTCSSECLKLLGVPNLASDLDSLFSFNFRLELAFSFLLQIFKNVYVITPLNKLCGHCEF